MATPTLCVLEPQEQLPIMLQFANTDLDFSLGKNLDVCVGYTPLKQDIIFFMSAEGLTNIRIQEGTRLATLSCFLSLTLVCLLFQTPLHHQFQVELIISFFCSFPLSPFFFYSSLFCFFSLYLHVVSSVLYIVMK